MTELHASIRDIPMPKHMRSLPLTENGYPVLWFSDINPETGKPDLRIMDGRKFVRAVKEKRCWLCGHHLGRHLAFVLGPMCTVTRTTAEPPCHRDCALYAMQACPFLTRPHMRRREAGMPEDASQAGIGLKRNPGCMALWTTRDYKTWQPPNGGVLITVGDPETVEWFAEGRQATYSEVADSLESGLPLLYEQALLDKDKAGALADLHKYVGRALPLLRGLPGREERTPDQATEAAMLSARGEEIAWFKANPDEVQYIRRVIPGEYPGDAVARFVRVTKDDPAANQRTREFGDIVGGRFFATLESPG